MAIPPLIKFPTGMSCTMVLMVIFHIKVSAGLRLFLSCLGHGVVRQNFR